MTDARVKDLNQELFSELTEPLVQPILVHMVPPFANGKDPKFCLQINGNILWEWRKLDGSLEKLFAVLQANLRPNGYRLEESAYDRVSNLLNRKTRTFVNKIKAEDNGKRKQRKKAETWMKLFIDPHEVCQSPYDIFAEMSDKENELNRTKQLYFSPQQIHQPT